MKAIFDKLKHSPIHNYILPGLTSWMLKASTESSGAVRMFESRVLRADTVENTIYPLKGN